MGKNILLDQKETSAPKSGQKRGRKVNSPGELTHSQSPTSSPETKTAKRMNGPPVRQQGQQSLPADLEALLKRMDEMLDSKLKLGLAPIKVSLAKIENANNKIKKEIVMVKNDLERIKK